MRGNFHVVLDACVLVSYSVCDLLLRLAETPRLHSPHWSNRILDETCMAYRTRRKNPWPEDRVQSFRSVLELHFPEAMVSDFDHLEASLQNDPKDRHVLAAAIKAQASTIVTFNLKDFQPEALAPCGIEAVHPSEYLVALYSVDSGLVVSRLNDMATSAGISPPALLSRLAKTVPMFSSHVADALGWTLDDGQ